MKQKLLNSVKLRVAMLVSLFLLIGGGNYGAAWADEYKLVKNASELTIGDVILITNAYSGSAYALGTTQNTNNRAAASVSITDETITTLGSAQEIILYARSSGNFVFKVGDNSYLYAASSSANNLKTNSSTTYWNISINTTTYVASITDATHTTNRNQMKYNANNGNPIFSCYSSADNNLFVFKKQTAPTYALTITEPVGGTITVLDDEANDVNSGDKFEENAELTISAEASTGYTFTTWTKTAGTFGSAATEADNTFTMPASAATIGATFTKNSYDLSLTNTNGSCAVTVDGVAWDGSSKIPYNAEVEITATPNDGYLFVDWTTDLDDYDGVTNPLTFNMPAGDVEVIASFADASLYYSITVDDDVTGGTISADKNTAAEDATVTLTATPATGYTFTSWTVKDASLNTVTVTANQFTMPASNVTVTATFTPIAVTGVTLNKTSASIGVGDNETLTATVAPANALNKTVTWTSSNTSVATVSAAGVVTGVAAGSATITATTEDGSFTATCTVTVENVVTFDATKDTGTSLSKNGVTFTTSATESSVYKFYKSSSTTFATTNGKITRIVFTGVSDYAISNMTANTGTLNTTTSPNGEWTGNVTSVTFTASTAQTRASKIQVYVATTATPTFSVAEGEYSEAKSVAISCATDGAAIYYTTDGSTPTSSSTAYSSAIDITTTTTLKAIAIKGGVESDVASATYTMNRPTAPTFDVAEGIFAAAFTLHLSAADGATIYYTTDGTVPTTSSSTYSTGISIPAASTTVKAIAVKSGLTSDVATAAYTYDTRPAPTFTLSATSVDLKVNETSSAVSLTTNSDGAVTFACADAHVTLTGTGTSRTITANAAGTYTVNVSTAATSNYLAGAGTITVNVTKKATTMAIETTFDGFDLKTATVGLIEGTVKYNDAEVAGAEVTYSSSDESVATVDEDGNVSFLRAGSTTLTASYAGDAEYEACEETYALVLINTTPVLNETVTFSAEGYDNGAAVETVTKNNFTVAFDKGTNNTNAPKYYTTGTAVRAYGGNTFTVSSSTKHIGKIELTFGDSDGSNVITTDEDTYSDGTWTGLAQSVTFTIGGTSGNRRISAIKVTYVESVTVTSASYATYASIYPLDFTGKSIKAYIAKADGTTGVTFHQVNKVPANTGVLLYKDGGATEGIPVFDGTGADDVTDNVFVKGTGATVASVDGELHNYILNNVGGVVGFYKAAGQKVAANRAYIQIDESTGVKAFFTLPGSEVDGINTIDNDATDHAEIYNLAGQRLSKLQRGINIVNGRKVLVK